MYRLLAFVIADASCHCGRQLSLRAPAVIADLIRNPVLANTGSRIESGMTNAWSLRTPAVIADLIRNPVRANTGSRIESGMTATDCGMTAAESGMTAAESGMTTGGGSPVLLQLPTP